MLGRKVPITSGYENERRLWLNVKKTAGILSIPLKGTCLLTDSLALSSNTGMAAQKTPRHTGKNGIVWLWANARTAFSQTKELAGAIVPLLSTPSTKRTDTSRQYI